MLTALLSWVPRSFPSTLKTFQHGTCRSIRGLIPPAGRQWFVQVLFARQPAEPDRLAARPLSRCAHQFTRRHDLVCFIKMHRTDHTARAETLYLLCAAPIGVPARAGYQPSRSCRLDSVARSAKGRPSLQMQPNDHGWLPDGMSWAYIWSVR